MCGIMGYIGKQNAQEILLSGLETLSYRGYDSAGIAVQQEDRLQVIEVIVKQQLNVAKTESYIESYLQRQQAPRKGIRKFILRDVRLFLNSVNHSLDLVRGAGIDAKAEQAETDHEIVLTIRLPKRIGQTETVR